MAVRVHGGVDGTGRDEGAVEGIEAEVFGEGDWGGLLGEARRFADELAGRPNVGLAEAPIEEIERLGEIGLLTAPLPRWAGGVGLGTEAGSQGVLLRVLAAIGGGDLALGRIYEGHVNGLLLTVRYGTEEQVRGLAEDCAAGMISGVWNTGARSCCGCIRLTAGCSGLRG